MCPTTNSILRKVIGRDNTAVKWTIREVIEHSRSMHAGPAAATASDGSGNKCNGKGKPTLDRRGLGDVWICWIGAGLRIIKVR